ncbi:uncharacterized protein LOC134543093 isoform X2 [Bacillus rossius redtenbacheri]|uniref:uncharacterized protein LOC134543093 isoform X2 n=1 Tax=Bacillus rossius redtenbacheri TaxID=93214 RepID=UPI002FDEBC02
MSDSDDTDALLLVPPDLFYIHSDSEDNFFCDVSEDQNPQFERMVVNDLIHHVSELENRVHVIEHKDSLNPYCSDRSFCSQQWDCSADAARGLGALHLSGYSRGHCGSFENVRNYSAVCQSALNVSATPVKKRLPLSLPSTPSFGCYALQHHALDCSVQPSNSLEQHLLRNIKPSEDERNMFQPTMQNANVLSWPAVDNVSSAGLSSIQKTATPRKTNQEQDLMSEIDEFLNSVQKKHPEKVQENDFGMNGFAGHQLHRNSESASVSFSAQSQVLPSARQHGLDSEIKGLALSDVGRLLDEVESTQKEIMQKLHDINKPFPERALSLETSLSANGPVPKLDVSEISTQTQGRLLTSTIAGKENGITSHHIETSRQQTEWSVDLTENTLNSNKNSAPNTLGLNRARRKLDLGGECPASSGVATGTSDVSDGAVFVDPTSHATLASSLNSVASSSLVPSAHGNRTVPAQLSSHSAQERAAAGPSLEPGPPSSVPGHAQRLGDTSQAFFPSDGISNDASGDDSRQEPPKLDYENNPVTRVAPERGHLLSLSELWSGSEGQGPRGDGTADPGRRLEEEHYRRQHCEQLIRQLQGRLLEEQQRLAVALEVDRAKDRAITRLRAGWRQLAAHWRGLEEQLLREREARQLDLARAEQRAKQLEGELSRTLGLAEDYRGKSEAASREREEAASRHRREMREAAARVRQAEEALEEARARGEEAAEQLLRAEQEARKEKQAKEAIAAEMGQCRETLADLEAELLAAKEEKASLQMKLKEERNRTALLDKQKKALQAALEDLKKREAGREEARAAAEERLEERLERARRELRDHYQRQVEGVVAGKMQEFQAQLDAAEASMRAELQQRESAVTRLAARQIKSIAEKHEEETRLLGEKHREEQQMLRLQLAQSTQLARDLEAELALLQSQRAQLARRLHGIMEVQWRESLRVITGASPAVPPATPRPGEPARGDPSLAQGGSCAAGTDQDGRATAAQPQQPAGVQRADGGDELRKYIAMLLDCKPGNPVGDVSVIPTSECGHIPARTQQEYLGAGLSDQDRRLVQGYTARPDPADSSRDSQAGKPPWK